VLLLLPGLAAVVVRVLVASVVTVGVHRVAVEAWRGARQVDAPAVVAAGEQEHKVQRVKSAVGLVDLVQRAVAPIADRHAALDMRRLSAREGRRGRQLSKTPCGGASGE
jgi:hypothetical protein